MSEFGGVHEQINNISAVFTIPASHARCQTVIMLPLGSSEDAAQPSSVLLTQAVAHVSSSLANILFSRFGLFVLLIKEGRCVPPFAGI